MSFNKKKLVFSFVVFAIAAGYGYRWYQASRPTYVPPPPREEVTITIIPGWNLRHIAADWQKKGILQNPKDLYVFTGVPAQPVVDRLLPLEKGASTGTPAFPLVASKNISVSYEGYLFPDTYRVYKDADIVDILRKIFTNLENKITPDMRAEMERQNKRFFEILTMASILEKEVTTAEEKAKVADILWRRNKMNWALQVDSSVHYVADKSGTPYTTQQERAVDSRWNTYKYPGLPLGPISNPGLDSIRAAIFPEKNNYWYFLTTPDGEVKYGRTLDEHNDNRVRYLR